MVDCQKVNTGKMNKNKLITAIFAMMLGFTSVVFAEELGDQETNELSSAREALERGQNDRALELLEPLYENYPLNNEIVNNFAVALFNNGQTAEAGIVLQGYLQAHEDVGTAATNLFSIYDFLAAESYAILSGSEAERPSLKVATTQPEKTSRVEQPSSTATLPASNDPLAAEISRRLEGYIAAWSNGDAAKYLSFYFPSRSPIRGLSFDSWREQRLSKIFPERDISIQIDEVQILPIDESQAIAVFKQAYSAKNYSDNTTKQLTWLKQDGEWYIRHEIALPN